MVYQYSIKIIYNALLILTTIFLMLFINCDRSFSRASYDDIKFEGARGTARIIQFNLDDYLLKNNHYPNIQTIGESNQFIKSNLDARAIDSYYLYYKLHSSSSDYTFIGVVKAIREPYSIIKLKPKKEFIRRRYFYTSKENLSSINEDDINNLLYYIDKRGETHYLNQ